MNNNLNRNIFKAFLTVSLLVSSSVYAQDSEPVSEVIKVAVLDMTTALFNSERARVLSDEVDAETLVDQQKVRDLAEEAQALQEELQQNAAVMSEDEQRKKSEDIQELAVQYDYLVQKIEAYVQGKREEFQQAYAPSLVQAVTDIVEEEQYDIVIRSEAALYFKASYDITALVTERLNQQ